MSSCDQPQTLLLFFDEKMNWLTGDSAYTARWAAALTEVLATGNRIRIVHTVTRNVDEMILGVVKWLPIYMTASIEPLYYPGSRDDLFQRTLFIAPSTAAIVANSTNRKPDACSTFTSKSKAPSKRSHSSSIATRHAAAHSCASPPRKRSSASGNVSSSS